MFRCWIPLICFVISHASHADDPTPSRTITGDMLNNEEAVQLSVIDTYLELHTGPGRGYPIFHVMEKGETVYVHSRRTNWFYVSDRRNRQGWVKQEGLARTLAPTGLPAALPNTKHGDFLAQQGRVGFSLGQQGNADTATVMAGYRLLSFAGIEAEYGQIFGSQIDGITYGASLLIEPIKSWSFTPFISKGYGWQEWKEKTKQQVGANNSFNSRYEYTGVGINYYIGYNFVVRGEYRKVYLTGDNDSLSNSAWRLGFSSFF
ncbi:SH3 domain-containing protein [Pseudomonas sp. HK3]